MAAQEIYFKEYWNNGKLKNILTGLLYKNNRGSFAVDSGHSEVYFENGQLEELNDWENKLPVASKQWNKNGVLIKEFVFPQHFKTYWNNGKPKGVITGILYRDDQGNFHPDSGHSESYFENGKIEEQNDWKDKLPIAHKEWNEKGPLIKEVVFPKDAKE